MRCWNPRAQDVVHEVKKYNPAEIILLPLYPQFSAATSGSSIKEWEEVCKKEKYKVKFIITENLMLANDTIVFNESKDTKKKKKKKKSISPAKKKRVSKNIESNKKLSEKSIVKKKEQNTSKVLATSDLKEAKIEKLVKEEKKPVVEKKVRSGPKKTGWWNQ